MLWGDDRTALGCPNWRNRSGCSARVVIRPDSRSWEALARSSGAFLPILHSGPVGTGFSYHQLLVVTMGKRPTEEGVTQTAYKHFLYLLFEMERVVERGGIRWPAGQASAIQSRLAQIARRVAQASDRASHNS